MKPVFNQRSPRFQVKEEKSSKSNANERKNNQLLSKNRKGTPLSLGHIGSATQSEKIYPTEAKKANGQGQVKINVKSSKQ